MALELEDLSAEMVKPAEGVFITLLPDGNIAVAIQELTYLESMMVMLNAMAEIEDHMTEEEAEEFERWANDDD